jgi:hypothetical protein
MKIKIPVINVVELTVITLVAERLVSTGACVQRAGESTSTEQHSKTFYKPQNEAVFHHRIWPKGLICNRLSTFSTGSDDG